MQRGSSISQIISDKLTFYFFHGVKSILTPLPKEKTTLEKPSLIKVNNKLLKSFLNHF